MTEKITNQTLEDLEHERDNLSAEERELQEKLLEIKNKRLSLEAEIELRKPVEISVFHVDGQRALVQTRNKYRDDVVRAYRAAPGHTWNAYNRTNSLPVKSWPEFLEAIQELDAVKVVYSDGMEELIEYLLNAPDWYVDLEEEKRVFVCTPGPGQGNLFYGIDGYKYIHKDQHYTIPLSEGWRIPEALKDTDVVYTEEAKARILGDLENRARLERILKEGDSDFAQDLDKVFTFNPFQRVGVDFGYHTGGRFILSDGTGLGKTRQGIGIVEKFRQDDPGFLTLCNIKARNVLNWVYEIQMLTGTEPVICKNDENSRNVALYHLMMRDRPYFIISHDTLGTYEEKGTGEVDWDGKEKTKIVYHWPEIFLQAGVNMMIVDEGHKIKNPDTHRSRATRSLAGIPHIIVMTATPIINRANEFWPLLYLVDPEKFGSFSEFVNTHTWDGKQLKNPARFHETVRPIFLRRTKKDVLKDLPPIQRIPIFTELSAEAKENYEDVLRGLYNQIKMYDPSGQGGQQIGVTHIMAQFTRLRQICAADKVEATAEQALDLIDQAEEDEGKVLIFSQFKGTARAIANKLGNEAVCTVERRVDKDNEPFFHSLSPDDSHHLMERARRDDRVKFIVTTEASAEGGNLEFCDWVIFNDPFWSPMTHYQCEGRAHGRLSDPHAIDSFYIKADADIERWHYELLDEKLEIIEESVDGIETSRKASGSVFTDLLKKVKGLIEKGEIG